MWYKVRFINYTLWYKNIREELLEWIDNMLQNWDVMMRDDVVNFEKSIANYTWTKHAISVWNCTDGLFMSLYALWIWKWDEVITVSHTFVASINVIVQTWATPILVDIKDDYTIDIEEMEKAITPNTKAIIPVHMNWHMAEMDKIMEIAKKYNLKVIEDSAQALWATYKWKMAWSYWDAWSFSLYPAKILWTYWDGWIVTTNNSELAEKLYMLRDHGMRPWYIDAPEWEEPKTIHYHWWNSRLDNIHAVILNIKLKYFQDAVERRREIAKMYDNELSWIDWIIIPPHDKINYYDNYQNYVMKVKNRNELKDFLIEKWVETLVKDAIPNHKRSWLKLNHFDLPNTDKISDEVISLPMYPELPDEEIKYVIEKVKEFYK